MDYWVNQRRPESRRKKLRAESRKSEVFKRLRSQLLEERKRDDIPFWSLQCLTLIYCKFTHKIYAFSFYFPFYDFYDFS